VIELGLVTNLLNPKAAIIRFGPGMSTADGVTNVMQKS